MPRSTQIADELALTTSYQVVTPSGMASLHNEGGDVALVVKRTGGTSVTFKIEEYFGSVTGWVTRVVESGANLVVYEKTSTEAAFSYYFKSLAEQVRISVKGAGSEVIDAFLTTGKLS